MTVIDRWITVMDTLPTTENRQYLPKHLAGIVKRLKKNVPVGKELIPFESRGPSIDLDKVAIKILRSRLIVTHGTFNDTEELQLRISLLSTPMGRYIEAIDSCNLYIMPVGYGTIDENGVVSDDYSFAYFNVGFTESSFRLASKINV